MSTFGPGDTVRDLETLTVFAIASDGYTEICPKGHYTEHFTWDASPWTPATFTSDRFEKVDLSQ